MSQVKVTIDKAGIFILLKPQWTNAAKTHYFSALINRILMNALAMISIHNNISFLSELFGFVFVNCSRLLLESRRALKYKFVCSYLVAF